MRIDKEVGQVDGAGNKFLKTNMRRRGEGVKKRGVP